MVSRLLAVLVGGALLGALAGPALAAGPADVSVRVEGATATLVPRTAVRTDTTAINKDGMAGHTCSGTGAAGALEKATGGDWSGPWFDGLGYSVQTIKGESHVFPAPEYFALWINYKSASEGVCGTTTELQQGDDVLFFVDRCVSDPVTFLCTNPPVLPLRLSTPRTVTPGAPFGVNVVEYAADGTSVAGRGRDVTGGDAPHDERRRKRQRHGQPRRAVQPARDEGQPRALGHRAGLRDHRCRRLCGTSCSRRQATAVLRQRHRRALWHDRPRGARRGDHRHHARASASRAPAPRGGSPRRSPPIPRAWRSSSCA